MRRWYSNPRVYIPALVLVWVGWVMSFVPLYGWELRLNGPYAGTFLHGNPLSLVVLVRGGWPSKAWIDREHLRAPGEMAYLTSDYTPTGFGLLVGVRRWYGNDVITVWHAGIAVPWRYLLLLALAPPGEQAARWFWAQRRSERRKRAGRCVRCGYDLRATPDRCPECGAATTASGSSGSPRCTPPSA